MPQSTAYPFGIRDIKVTPITGSDDTLGTPVDLPAARTLSFKDGESFETLRGDDQNITSLGGGPEITWDLEAGGISMAAYAVFAGVTVATTGTTPAQVDTMTKKTSSVRPYFRIEGQSISDSGGDIHVVLYRCKTTGDIEGELSDGNFFITKCSGEAFGSRAAASLDKLYDIIQNETAVAIETT